MSIRQAVLSDLHTVRHISATTIAEVYPHYYPKGAVDFFLKHPNEANIQKDMEREFVFLCYDSLQNAVGTITIKGNEICRLFVLPPYQGQGFGTEMLDFAEKKISGQYLKIVLDASLPAKKIYLRRGYKEIDFHMILTGENDFLCYDVMEKQIAGNMQKLMGK